MCFCMSVYVRFASFFAFVRIVVSLIAARFAFFEDESVNSYVIGTQ